MLVICLSNVDDHCSTQAPQTPVQPDPLDPERALAEVNAEGNVLVAYSSEMPKTLKVELMDSLYLNRWGSC